MRSRNSRCWVVTPAHVVEGAPGAIAITGDGGTRGTAQLRQSYAPQVDLAVLEVTSGSFACTAWALPASIDALLATKPTSSLRLRGDDGGFRFPNTDIRAIGPDMIRVRAAEPTDPLLAGMSGGQLVVGGMVAGLLIDVDTGETGRPEGRVLRLDVIDRIVAGVFNPGPATDSIAAELAFADLSGRWSTFDLGSGGAFDLKRVGSSYEARLVTRGRTSDFYSLNEARVGDLMFRLKGPVSAFHLFVSPATDRVYPTRWVREHDVEVYYYEGANRRCAPIPVPGMVARVEYNARDKYRSIVILNVPVLYVSYNSDDKSCKTSALSVPVETISLSRDPPP